MTAPFLYEAVFSVKGEMLMAQTDNNFIMLPTVDFCFKELMQNEKVRKGFIAALLGRNPEEIRETALIPTILPTVYSDDKPGVLDVAVLLKDGTQIDMEMQVIYFSYWTHRILFYLGKLYTGQIKKGESYKKLKKCIHVSILDFIHFPDDKKCYHKILFCDSKTGTPYTDLMELHIVELKKIPPKVRNEDGIIRWMRFFSGKTREEFSTMAKTDEYISEAYSELMKLSADEKKRLEYEAREKAVRDYNTLMDSARSEGLKMGLQEGIQKGLEEGRQKGIQEGRQEGMQEGRQEGMQEGRQQGRESTTKEYTCRMLSHGMSPAEIADLLGEDRQMIDKIAAEFRQETEK